jgi:hypothetical protein
LFSLAGKETFVKTLLTIGLLGIGAAAAAQPAQAGSLVICTSTACGAPSGNTEFNLNDFEAGFDVNGSLVQEGLGSPATIFSDQAGTFVDGAAENTFSGNWVDLGETTTKVETVFFTDTSGGISDVLNFNYSTNGVFGSISGYVISGALTVAGLASVGITPTSTVPERGVFTFNNAFISASIQTGPAIPEPSTWAMVMLGFAGLSYAGLRRSARARAAAA